MQERYLNYSPIKRDKQSRLDIIPDFLIILS